MKQRQTRAEAPIEQTWNLFDLFASEAAWHAEYTAVDAALPGIALHQGQLSTSAQHLLSCLNAVEALLERFARISTYAYLRNAQDGTNPQYQAAAARAAALGARMDSSIAFVESKILALPVGLVTQYQSTEPALAAHRVVLTDLMELRPHRLGAEAERVLASLGEVLNAPYMVYNRSKSGDIQFAPFTNDAGEYFANSINGFESDYESHSDTSLRRGAWKSFSAGLKAYNHTYAATFATEVNKNVTMGRLRRKVLGLDKLL